MRRAYDTLNVRSADVMVVLEEDIAEEGNQLVDPYGYAHLLAIGHAMVKYIGPNKEEAGEYGNGQWHRVDLLRVRWYDHDPEQRMSWESRRLPSLSIVPAEEEGAYGFLDPADVVRGCHIIPAFRYGEGSGFEVEDPESNDDNDDEDSVVDEDEDEWEGRHVFYNVGMYVSQPRSRISLLLTSL